MSFPIGVKTKPIFQSGALDKETLLLKKFISPKTEQGVLSPSGGDKPNFYFLGSRERYAIIEEIHASGRPIGSTFSIGGRQT